MVQRKKEQAPDPTVSPQECYVVPEGAESRYSTFYEQMREHVCIAEILQEAWFGFGKIVEVLRAEVDNAGYDVVLECDRKLRHVQFKGSRDDAKASFQKVNLALSKKPSGCIVWMRSRVNASTRRLEMRYLFFGNGPGEPLPNVENFPLATHAKGDSTGKKNQRPEIRKVKASLFREVSSTRELIKTLFGLAAPSNP
jgi:hypothetical protein